MTLTYLRLVHHMSIHYVPFKNVFPTKLFITNSTIETLGFFVFCNHVSSVSIIGGKCLTAFGANMLWRNLGRIPQFMGIHVNVQSSYRVIQFPACGAFHHCFAFRVSFFARMLFQLCRRIVLFAA